MMKKKFKKLFRKYKLIDQTAFITHLLAQGDVHRHNICNSSWYMAKTSKGTFKGTNVDYHAILDHLQYQLDNTRNKGKQKRLRKDITAIEDGYRGELPVQYWYAMPARLAPLLAANGFMVLRLEDGCWLGW